MRKKTLTAAVAAILSVSLLTISCIGSFTLTNKVLAWNNHVGNKFMNELVFFAFWILPVYEVCALADVLVINSIEFWSGSNPMASSEKVVEGRDGRYLVKCDGNGYDIISENDGSLVRLDFDSDTQTWSVATAEGESYKLMTIIDDCHVMMPGTDGLMHEVELSQQGAWAYQQMATSTLIASR